MRSSLAAALAATLALPASGWGRQPSPSVGAVSEAEFLAVAADAPVLRALRERTALAEAEALGARAVDNPRLVADREAPSPGTEQIDAAISWQPPRLDRRRLTIAATGAGVTAAQARLEQERLAVRLAMREAFARWAVAEQRNASVVELARRLESLALAQRRRAQAGEVSGLAARRIETAAAEAKGELARSGAELATARAAALAWRPDLPQDSRPQLPELPPPLSLATPPVTHPELAALEAELAQARLERDAAARVLELPQILAGWQRQRSELGVVAEGPLIGLEWPLPLFDRGRAERARGEARADALDARLQATRERLAATRDGAVGAYLALRDGARDASTAAEIASPMVEAALASFGAGETTVTDLLDTVRQAAAARLQALELHAASLAAQRELERTLGEEIAPELGDSPAAPLDASSERGRP
jgi:outer membrane protein TolC